MNLLRTKLFTGLFYILSAAVLILFFQNCGSNFNSISAASLTQTNNTFGADPAPTAQPTPQPPSTPQGAYKAISGITNVSILSNGEKLCSITSTGAVACSAQGNHMVLMPGLSDIKKLVDSCALNKSGRVFCWGNNYTGAAGLDPATAMSAPVTEIQLGEVAVDLSGFIRTQCAVLASGKIKCWGAGDSGQLGDGQVHNSFTPVNVLNITNAVKIFGTTYQRQVCALGSDGSIFCWGANIQTPATSTPVLVYKSNKVVSVGMAVTPSTFCVLENTGKVLCKSGLDANNNYVMAEMPNITNGIQLISNDGTYCVRTSDLKVYCWGTNMFGRLGFTRLHNEIISIPTLIPAFTGAVDIYAASWTTCAAMSDSTVKCIGSQMGFTDYMHSVYSAAALGFTSGIPYPNAVLDTNAGLCIQTSSSDSKCWGELNTAMDFSTNSPKFSRVGDDWVSVPMTLSSTSVNQLVSLPYGGACAITPAAEVQCYGVNDYGQLGNGTTLKSDLFTKVIGVSNVIKIVAYEANTCAITSAHKLFCWGIYNSDLFGINNLNEQSVLTAREVTSVTDVKDVLMTYQNILILQNTAHLYSLSPGRSIFELSSVESFDLNTNCAVKLDKSITCMNWNWDTSSGTYSNIPLSATSPLYYLNGASCLINTDKTVSCWGLNTSGQLGQGDKNTYANPVIVKGVSNATSVFSSFGSYCAYVDADLGARSRILCWGNFFANAPQADLLVVEKLAYRGYRPVMNSSGGARTFVSADGDIKSSLTNSVAAVPFTVYEENK